MNLTINRNLKEAKLLSVRECVTDAWSIRMVIQVDHEQTSPFMDTNGFRWALAKNIADIGNLPTSQPPLNEIKEVGFIRRIVKKVFRL